MAHCFVLLQLDCPAVSSEIQQMRWHFVSECIVVGPYTRRLCSGYRPCSTRSSTRNSSRGFLHFLGYGYLLILSIDPISCRSNGLRINGFDWVCAGSKKDRTVMCPEARGTRWKESNDADVGVEMNGCLVRGGDAWRRPVVWFKSLRDQPLIR